MMQAITSVLIVLAIAGVVSSQQLSDCDPIDPSRCALPLPNNFWLRSNATTGRPNLQFGLKTFPLDNKGKPIDPIKGGWVWLDGFSPFMPITTYFANLSLNLSNLPHYWEMDASLAANCGSVIIDTSTGRALPHWTELDFYSGADADQALLTYPSKRLSDSTRYIVAFRNLRSTTGAAISPSTAFRALRDNITTSDYDIESRRPLFNDMFSRLQSVGFSRDSIILAWDFTTASRESSTSKLVTMRDDAFRRVASSGVQWQITNVQQNVSAYIARQVNGNVLVPFYANKDAPGATLVLDTNGVPVYQTMVPATFTVRIPRSLAESTTALGSVLQYGHGLFGTQHEVENEYLAIQADQHGYVLLAVDWLGLSESDEIPVGAMMATDLTNFGMMPDRCQQGILNALFAMRLLREGRFAKDAAMTFNGRAILAVNPEAYYTGNSQGGILGTVYMAITTDVRRGVLGVPGGPYSLLLPRSSDWPELGDIIKGRYSNSIDRAIIYDILQLLWDRADPGPYCGYVTSNPLPNTPTHEVILHNALGDKQVTYLGAFTIARSMGASMFESNVNEPGEKLFGFPLIKDSDIGHTAMQVTWDYPNVPPVPRINIPPFQDQDTHGYPRKEQTAQDMMYRFFTTGDIVNTCRGPCHGTPKL